MRTVTPTEKAVSAVRAKAEEYRSLADENRARLLEWAADGFEQALREEASEMLTIEQAAKACGYHPDSLSRMVREGQLPDLRPPGSHGRILIRRKDLPVKPGRAHTPPTDVVELASRLGIPR